MMTQSARTSATKPLHCYLELHARFDFISHNFRQDVVKEHEHFVCRLGLDLALVDKVVECVDK